MRSGCRARDGGERSGPLSAAGRGGLRAMSGGFLGGEMPNAAAARAAASGAWGRGGCDLRLLEGAPGAVGIEQLAPRGLEDVAHPRLAVDRVPEAVVVGARGGVAPRHDRRAQQQVLERLERPPVDELLAARGERVLVEAAAEAEVHVADVLAHDLDLGGVP